MHYNRTAEEHGANDALSQEVLAHSVLEEKDVALPRFCLSGSHRGHPGPLVTKRWELAGSPVTQKIATDGDLDRFVNQLVAEVRAGAEDVPSPKDLILFDDAVKQLDALYVHCRTTMQALANALVKADAVELWEPRLSLRAKRGLRFIKTNSHRWQWAVAHTQHWKAVQAAKVAPKMTVAEDGDWV